MARIPVHTVETAPPASRDALQALQAKYGKVLNIHGAMAHAPVVINAYAALQQVIAIRQGHVTFDNKLQALLNVARESAGNPGQVDDATWEAALKAGWNDTELTELSVHLTLNLFTNHFNHLVETDLDLPRAPGL